MFPQNKITTLNPLGIILRQHRINDIQLAHDIIEIIDNDYLPDYKDYVVRIQEAFTGLIDTIITTNQTMHIESLIHQYHKRYFTEILNILEGLEGNIEITKPELEDGQYIIFDRGEVMTSLWLVNGDTKLSVQHATKDFIFKLGA